MFHDLLTDEGDRDRDDGPDSVKREGLGADDRGAIMVIGVFMAVLLVGMIYYVMGLGQSILYHERMQDAADAGAFGAAVLHARGMNIIALLNILMAAVLSVLVAIKVLHDLLTAALTIATAICAACSCPGCCGCCLACPFVPVLSAGEEFVGGVEEAAEPAITAILEAASAAAEGVKIGYPFVAQAKVMQYGRETYHEPTKQGFMYPFIEALPVETDDSDLLCEKAAEQAGNLAAPRVLGAVRIFIATAVSGLATMFSSRYCGDDDSYAMKIEDGLAMGDEEFQVRAFMVGKPTFERSSRGVAVAAWGQERDASGSDALEALTKLSFAQAEFYFDGPSDTEEWMWHLDWKARLRRFRLPSGGLGGLGGECDVCGGLSDMADLDGVVVH